MTGDAMTFDDLRSELQRLRVPVSSYSLETDSDESYCLVHESDGWHVYYSERGNRNAEQVLPTEAGACQRLLERVLPDSTVRRELGREP